MTTHTPEDGATTPEYFAPVRILNATDAVAFNFRLPASDASKGLAGHDC